MKLPLIIFVISASFLSFAYGLAVGKYEVFPYASLKYVLNSVERVLADPGSALGTRPSSFLAEIRYDGSGVTVYDEDAVQPGTTLLSGFFDNELPEIRLVSLDGEVLQSWPVSVLDLFPDLSHVKPEDDIPANDWGAAVHGIRMEPDGAILFNFDGKGTAKLDRCGDVVWTLPHMTHHSIDRSRDGSYWIPSRQWRETSGTTEMFRLPYRDDTILRVSAQGEVLSEISLNQILVDNGLYAILVANGDFETKMRKEDVLHINDIEELSADLAGAFPHFEAGDLLLSMRHLNLLLVVDPDDWSVKWYRVGPWLRQHDPDFQPDGTITVFNNNSDDTVHGELLGGSNILRFDPFSPTHEVSVWYDDDETPGFFTNTQGKHQVLSNGNTLIAEYWGGRVLEVTPDGRIVWEFVNKYDDEAVAKISGAVRYPAGYLLDPDWSC